LSETVRKRIEQRLRETGMPGISWALVSGDGVVADAVGVADRESGEPLSPQHLLQACSISKFATAMVTLLVAEGAGLDLDADVNDYLRHWQVPVKAGWPPVTLRSLLCHQAGLDDPAGSFDSLRPGEPAPAPLDILSGSTRLHPEPVAPRRAPYAGFAYSDAGYCLVEQVLQDATGKEFGQLAAEYLWRPLGIAACRVEQPLRRGGLVPDAVAKGHGQDRAALPWAEPVYPYLAAAGLWCTPTAYASMISEVLQAVRGKGKLLSAELAGVLLAEPGVSNICLGSFRSGGRGNCFIYGLGWGKGFQCEFRFWPELARGLVVMLNANPGVEQSASLVGEAVAILAAETGC